MRDVVYSRSSVLLSEHPARAQLHGEEAAVLCEGVVVYQGH